jgi:hypothetical protein
VAGLTRCVRCGGTVSTGAVRCPHCGEYPRHVERWTGSLSCVHCGGQVKAAEADNLMHPVCNEVCEQLRAKKGAFTCPRCSAVLRYSDFRFTYYSAYEGYRTLQTGVSLDCPGCGHPLKLEKCWQCSGPLFKETGVTVPRRDRLPVYVHEFCVPDVQYRRMPGPNNPGCTVFHFLARFWHSAG